jgi:hypothetical protein
VFYTVELGAREKAMGTATSPAELNGTQMDLSERERLRFQAEFLEATSLGWEQVMTVLRSYVRDPETRESLEELLAA